jgi:hypothetical protein
MFAPGQEVAHEQGKAQAGHQLGEQGIDAEDVRHRPVAQASVDQSSVGAIDHGERR